MTKVSMIGLDLGKNAFQVHAIDARGNVVVRKQLRRNQIEKFFAGLEPVIVGIEACGGALYWGRVLGKLGHEVRMVPPAYVKAYRKRNKTDGRDAEAICDAMDRPTMRFVPAAGASAHHVGQWVAFGVGGVRHPKTGRHHMIRAVRIRAMWCSSQWRHWRVGYWGKYPDAADPDGWRLQIGPSEWYNRLALAPLR
jgi:hypothetical protein